MNKIKMMIALGAFLATTILMAQQNYYGYRVGVSYGTMGYWGDLTDQYPRLSAYLEPAMGLQLERSLSKTLGLRLTASQGAISYNDRTVNHKGEFLTDNPNFDRGLNFRTDIRDAALSFVFHTDNDRQLNDDAFIAPYLSVGFGVTSFDVFGNLRNANNEFYGFLGEDGEQDDTYETDLRALNNESEFYEDYTFHIPFGAGVKFRLGDRFNLNVETNLKYAFSDYLDDVSARGYDNNLNDVYGYANVALNYNFGLKKRAFNAPKWNADKYARLEKGEDALYSETGLALQPSTSVDSSVVEEPVVMSKKEARQQRKAEAVLVTEAIETCRERCKQLPRKDRKACKQNCEDEDAYAIYMDNSTDVPNVVVNGEATNYQSKLDSLEQVIAQEGQQRSQSPAGHNNGVKYDPYASVGQINTGQQGVNGVMNSRDIQDLKLQMELMKSQGQGGGNTGTVGNADPVLEMYRLEVDRLRQEASDNKIMGKLELIEDKVGRLENGDIDIERKVVVEQGDVEEVVKGDQTTTPVVETVPNAETAPAPVAPVSPSTTPMPATPEGMSKSEEAKVKIEEINRQIELLKNEAKAWEEIAKDAEKAEEKAAKEAAKEAERMAKAEEKAAEKEAKAAAKEAEKMAKKEAKAAEKAAEKEAKKAAKTAEKEAKKAAKKAAKDN